MTATTTPTIDPEITLAAVKAAMHRARGNGTHTFPISDFRIYVGSRRYTGLVAEEALSVLVARGLVERTLAGRYFLVQQQAKWVKF